VVSESVRHPVFERMGRGLPSEFRRSMINGKHAQTQ
jgi:hypothetical protein